MAKYDAIVALGGGITPEGRLAESSKQRISMAVSMFQQGLAAHIITSGRWSYKLDCTPATTEARAMKHHALAHGIGEAAIYTEEASQGTIANAYYIKQCILKRYGWYALAVVTCLDHAERTQLIFDHVLGDDYNVAVYPTLELPDENRRILGNLRLIATTMELSDVPKGNDQALEERFPYLQQSTVLASTIQTI